MAEEIVPVGDRQFTFAEAWAGDELSSRCAELARANGVPEHLLSVCNFAAALDGEEIVGYTAWRSEGVEGWDMLVTVVWTHPDHRERGLYWALNVWIVRDADPATTVCTYVNDPITEHVVQAQWHPHVTWNCPDGSRFYGTTVAQVAN